MRIILEPLGEVIRLSPGIPVPWWACARCIDRGETGGERTIGEVEPEGPAVLTSRTTGIPGIMEICAGPAMPGDLSLGDVTSLESDNRKENKNKSL